MADNTDIVTQPSRSRSSLGGGRRSRRQLSGLFHHETVAVLRSSVRCGGGHPVIMLIPTNAAAATFAGGRIVAVCHTHRRHRFDGQ